MLLSNTVTAAERAYAASRVVAVEMAATAQSAARKLK
jgi:hypothetical protein